MSDVHVVPSAAVEALRRKAKKLVKQNGIAHHAALDVVARSGGVFADWHHFIEAAKATEPTERAFKSGLVVGMDIKDALAVPDSQLTQFVRDKRLVGFVLDELGLRAAGELSEEAEWDRELIHETEFFRARAGSPESLEAALELVRKDFFFPPEYLRLGGKLLVNPLSDEDGDDGAESV